MASDDRRVRAAQAKQAAGGFKDIDLPSKRRSQVSREGVYRTAVPKIREGLSILKEKGLLGGRR